MPYHLWTLAPLLNGLLEQFGYQQADVLGISDRDRLGPEQPAASSAMTAISATQKPWPAP